MRYVIEPAVNEQRRVLWVRDSGALPHPDSLFAIPAADSMNATACAALLRDIADRLEAGTLEDAVEYSPGYPKVNA